jgi:hypothetical protein
MKRKKIEKPYWEMNADELAAATREFDKEIPDSRLRPLSKEERRRWERSKRQPSRSIFVLERAEDRGLEAVLVELDGDLLRRIDAYAATRDMTRSEIIETSLRSALVLAEARPKRKRRRSA